MEWGGMRGVGIMRNESAKKSIQKLYVLEIC